MRERDADVPVGRRQCAQLRKGNGGTAGERIPVRLRRRAKSGEWGTIVSRVERDVRVNHAQDESDRVADAAAFGADVVLDAARDPGTRGVLINDQREAVAAHSGRRGKFGDRTKLMGANELDGGANAKPSGFATKNLHGMNAPGNRLVRDDFLRVSSRICCTRIVASADPRQRCTSAAFYNGPLP